MEQDTLIFIDESEKLEASVAANTFAHKDTKNRAYINTLGAELALKYLNSENIDISNIHNIHSIKKILEEIDVSDIMLENIHIDVRVVFDENAIFIPKSHFEYNLVPDIYLVFNLAKDFSHVKFLGFFVPKLINKNNQNSDYYFIEKEKLTPAADLKNFITNFEGKTTETLSDDEIENSERIIISMADNDITEDDKKYLIRQLTKSAQLRDRFFEYENFETLSYKAMNDPQIQELITEETTDNLASEEVSDEAIENLEDLETLENLETVEDLDTLEEITDESSTEELVPLEEFAPIDEAETVDETALEDEVIDSALLENIDELPTEDNIEDTTETVSLENISEEFLPLDNVEENIENSAEDVISLDDLENVTTDEVFEEPVETVSLDDIETLSNDEPIENIEPVVDTLEEVMTDELPQNIEEDLKEDTESFGKNLLENLALEDIEDINIEPIEEKPAEEAQIQENIQQSDDLQELVNTFNEVVEQETIADMPDIEEKTFEQPESIIEEDETPQTGIDDLLNLVEQNTQQEGELEVLFNDTDTDSDPEITEELTEELTEEPPIPGAALMQKPKQNKKTLIAATALITVLAVGAAVNFLKPKADTDQPEPINTPLVENNILETNTPDINKTPEVKTTQPVKELKNTAAAPKTPIHSESYLNVSKLVWDVPDALSYSSKMQSYLRTAGKSIKLSLSADLLLATEYAYTNQVKVSLKLNKNGSVEDAKILTSSGSNQIDNIVLQSVKDTLNVVKPPTGEINSPDFNLNLIIYF